MSEAMDIEEMLYRPGTYEVEITPSQAAKLLEMNTANRRPKTRAVAKYAREMKEHRWRRTNQGLGVSRSMRLLDGQQRLLACQEADVPFRTLLTTGLDDEAGDVVDTGIKRSLSDSLTRIGKINSANLAGATSLRARYEWGVQQDWSWVRLRAAGQRFSHEELLAYLAKHPMLEDRTAVAWPVRKALGRVGLAAIVAFESMAFEVAPGPAAEFHAAMVSGAMMSEDDPRLLLRNWALRQERAPDSILTLAMFVRAWNLWIKGDSRIVLRVQENDRLPRLEAQQQRLVAVG